VLPDLADVTLDEEASQVIGQLDGVYWLEINCIFERLAPGFVIEGREARVVVKAADTADGLVVLLNIVVVVAYDGHFVRVDLGLLVSIVVLSAGAPSAEERVVVGARRGRGGILRWL
jgi:hypothetical protein